MSSIMNLKFGNLKRPTLIEVPEIPVALNRATMDPHYTMDRQTKATSKYRLMHRDQNMDRKRYIGSRYSKIDSTRTMVNFLKMLIMILMFMMMICEY